MTSFYALASRSMPDWAKRGGSRSAAGAECGFCVFIRCRLLDHQKCSAASLRQIESRAGFPAH
jgi:hypothetical protein